MAIQKLLRLIKQTNIAEDIARKEGGEKKLNIIGDDVIKGYDTDWASMAGWRDSIDTGMELAEPATGSRSDPWEGASNHKTPILMEARIKFGDRASEELLGSDDLVKVRCIGKDSDGEKEKRSERVKAVMNWQLTVESDTWLDEQDELLYNISDRGHIFKKTFFDPSLGHNVSEVINYPNFAINQDTKTLESALRFTQKIFKTPNQILEMQDSGIWRDVDIEFGATNSDNNEDDLTEFYEQQTSLDLDGDGYEEPYIVTVHACSGTVMRIKSQISLDGIFLRDSNGITLSVDKLLEKDEKGGFLLEDGELVIKEDRPRTIVKIKRDNNLTSYKFLTNPKGEFLGVGYFYVLGAYAQGINGTTNRLMDSGTLANMPTGWLAKNFRKRMGDAKLKPGSLNQTNLSPQDLQTGILMNTFKEPSATLLTLNNDMKAEAQRLSSSVDLGSVLGANTPATTALGFIQNEERAVGAIIIRIYKAMAKEFKIWYRLNAKYMDDDQYKSLVDDSEASPFDDFNTTDMDIVPVANPRNSSKLQRLQKAQAELSVLPQIAETGGNTKTVVENYLESIGSENVEDIYPELSDEQKAALEQQKAKEQQIAEAQIMIPLEAQAALGRAEELKAQARLIEAQQGLIKAQAETGLTLAKTDTEKAKEKLTIEQAETEATKNATSIIGAELEIEKAQREKELVQLDRGQVNDQQRTDSGLGGQPGN